MVTQNKIAHRTVSNRLARWFEFCHSVPSPPEISLLTDPLSNLVMDLMHSFVENVSPSCFRLALLIACHFLSLSRAHRDLQECVQQLAVLNPTNPK